MGYYKHGNQPSSSVKCGKFLSSWGNSKFSRRAGFHVVSKVVNTSQHRPTFLTNFCTYITSLRIITPVRARVCVCVRGACVCARARAWCGRVRVRACARVRVRAWCVCVRACGRACVRVCVPVCVRVCVGVRATSNPSKTSQ